MNELWLRGRFIEFVVVLGSCLNFWRVRGNSIVEINIMTYDNPMDNKHKSY